MQFFKFIQLVTTVQPKIAFKHECSVDCWLNSKYFSQKCFTLWFSIWGRHS